MVHPQSSTVSPGRPDASAGENIGLDDLFEALGSRWRRCAVRHLAAQPTDSTADALVDDLLAMYATPTDDRQETRIAFHHAHLPKLAALDVVDYDREAGTVAPGPTLDEAAACLEAVEDARA